MSRRAIATFCAIPTALFLFFIGILHSIVNVSQMGQAIERGNIPPRLVGSVIANAAFSGTAMSMLGLLLLLVGGGIRRRTIASFPQSAPLDMCKVGVPPNKGMKGMKELTSAARPPRGLTDPWRAAACPSGTGARRSG